MPDNEFVPEILRYQTHHDNTEKVMAELERIPVTLSPGQFLFHGGHWHWGLEVGTVVPIKVPLSTSLTAVTAACHSRDSGQKTAGPFYLWALRVSGSFGTPVYVYNYFDGGDQRHEFEVLLAPGGCMRVEYVESVRDYYVVGVVLE
ncbi:hypothetical protein HWD96_04620 [Pseudomonas putida]|uniref:hypothetical protein n=1 Tax=Pseudomonas putida TaxID=303 RepID=UPI001F51C321|nr:hypothetical protein [Pseudomonas putida]MCI1021506.1 hypothetical protein [Pseudomonas putida]